MLLEPLIATSWGPNFHYLSLGGLISDGFFSFFVLGISCEDLYKINGFLGDHLRFPIWRFGVKVHLFFPYGAWFVASKNAPIMPRRGNLCGCPAIPGGPVVIVNLNIRDPHGFSNYPPVIKHSNGKSPFSIWNTSSKGSFSIAMLDCQRVYTLETACCVSENLRDRSSELIKHMDHPSLTWVLLSFLYMGVNPKIGGFPPQIIHFNRVFHYKPSIFGGFTPIFGNTHIPSKTFSWIQDRQVQCTSW